MKTNDSELMIIRRAQLMAELGLGFGTIRRMIEAGQFPKPIQLGPRSIGWRTEDVKAWLDSRPQAWCQPAFPKKSQDATKPAAEITK